MPVYRYEALDGRGRRRRGEIEADGERAARLALRRQGLIPRVLAPLSDDRPAQTGRTRRRGLRRVEMAAFLEELATLVEAGAPVADALGAIAEHETRPRVRGFVVGVRQRVVEGSSLAEALAAEGAPEEVWRMVAAGEETGALEAVAARLAELMERRERMRQELLSATLYPAIVLGFGVVVMLVLLAVVVPQVTRVFAHAGAQLPAITQMVIAVSSFIRQHGIGLLALLAAGGIAARIALRRPDLAARWDALLLRLPVIGDLLLRIETARFARTLGMLLAGGVPMLAALAVANEAWRRAPLRRLGEAARERVREGGALADALAGLPPLAVRLVRVGEQSGRLDALLLRAADHFDRETSRRIQRMLTVLEPALVLLMAVGVGVMAVAILLPLVEMNELIR